MEDIGSIMPLSMVLRMTSLWLSSIGGRIVSFGIYAEFEGKLSFYQPYFKELLLINARAAKGEDYSPSIDLVRKGAVKMLPLIRQEMPLEILSKVLLPLDTPGVDNMRIILRLQSRIRAGTQERDRDTSRLENPERPN